MFIREKKALPTINVFDDFVGPTFTMHDIQVVLDPGYYMVLECSFNELM